VQRPEHHQDLRDHRPRPGLRDPCDARRGGLEARRRISTFGVTLRNSLALTAVLLVALLATGCGAVGRVTSGDTSKGKQLFAQKCASCHTLADSKSKGTLGPSLDDAFSSDKQQGFSQQTMADVVRGQIAYPDPEGPMQANLVTGSDADSVALYVAKCSGNPTCGVTAATNAPPAAGGSGGGKTAAPDGKTIFSAQCASCHTLKDAGATGAVGPNLDTLKPPQSIVEHQVTVGGGAMPPFKGTLTAAEITAVAKYVSSVAGK
jgi:mono/diheme cytochrome c family protein